MDLNWLHNRPQASGYDHLMFQLSRNKTEIEIEITGIFSVNEKLSEKNKESIENINSYYL